MYTERFCKMGRNRFYFPFSNLGTSTRALKQAGTWMLLSPTACKAKTNLHTKYTTRTLISSLRDVTGIADVFVQADAKETHCAKPHLQERQYSPSPYAFLWGFFFFCYLSNGHPWPNSHRQSLSPTVLPSISDTATANYSALSRSLALFLSFLTLFNVVRKGIVFFMYGMWSRVAGGRGSVPENKETAEFAMSGGQEESQVGSSLAIHGVYFIVHYPDSLWGRWAVFKYERQTEDR